MKTNTNPAKGMRDFLPNEKKIRDYIEGKIVDTYIKSGFEHIETPVVENIENLINSNGGENLKLIFKILKRGEKLSDLQGATENDLADLGLRFDLTVPLSRFYCNNKAKLPSVFKSIQAGNVFRAERAQKGRFRSFKQCDIDIIGDSSPNAEIELISVTATALRNLDIDKFSIRLNDRRVLKDVIMFCGFSEDEFESVCIIVDKLDKIALEGVKNELIAKEYKIENIEKLMQALLDINKSGTACLESYGVEKEIVDNVNYILDSSKSIDNNLNIYFDFTLVRGMGYYTGSIFEIEYDGLGYSIGGGGRYDKMIGNFIGEDVPAIGFSIGFERLVNQMIEENYSIQETEKMVVLYEKNSDFSDVMKKANELRSSGYVVSLHEKAKKLGKQLSNFESQGYVWYALHTADDFEVKKFEN